MSETRIGKAFASQGDMSEKKISFTEVGAGLWAFTAEGDPNTGVIVGDDSVMVVDAQATPRLAAKVIEKIRTVTDKPIKYVALSHYHAVRVLGASAYGPSEVIMSQKARAMVVERGQEDWDFEFQRFPRLFQGHESIPGLTWPTLTFDRNATFYLGKRRVDLSFLGRAHTAGDIVAYVPDANVMFTGDIVEYHSACYCGDAHYTDWPATLEAIRSYDVDAIAPGRGDALVGKTRVGEALDNTRDFVTLDVSARCARRARGRIVEGGLGRLSRGLRPEVRGLCDLRTLPARSTSRAPTTRRWASIRHASGPPSVTWPWGCAARLMRTGRPGTPARSTFDGLARGCDSGRGTALPKRSGAIDPGGRSCQGLRGRCLGSFGADTLQRTLQGPCRTSRMPAVCLLIRHFCAILKFSARSVLTESLTTSSPRRSV